MDLVTPGIGMIFWSTLFFLVLLFILGKFAWPAILLAVKARNESIRHALEAADRAKEEMAQLQADNEKILAEARAERDMLMKEAKEMKDMLIADAKDKAMEEANKLVKSARESIQREKAGALNDMKEQMANLSVDIAEKILRMKLEESKAQKELVHKLINEADLN
ncbi:MAG: ATP synthase F0 subunit B [Bacteroidetes bacterium]|nr:MAG: ATP synthase F0 subunit B [Bacteroidota bacterium]RLE05418.1 MAG: ATP synthase F0 subunit B [Bacteroidota bacterium]